MAREIEIGWTFLARSHWGGRYNSEMKQLMLRHAARFVDKVLFVIGSHNRRSQRAVEKLGGVRSGPRQHASGKEDFIYTLVLSSYFGGSGRRATHSFRYRSRVTPMTAPAAHATHLKRTLGLPAVLLFGLAYMAPLIVYGIYGDLAKASHDTAALAYLLALIAITFTALSYGRLTRIYPVAGSAYTYTRRNFNAHIGFMIGWATLLDYFFIPMVTWLIGAAYLNTAFPLVPTWVWIVAFIVLTSAVNIVGIELAARFNIALMAVQLVVIALFIALCWHYAVAAAGPGGLALAAPLFKPGGTAISDHVGGGDCRLCLSRV